MNSSNAINKAINILIYMNGYKDKTKVFLNIGKYLNTIVYYIVHSNTSKPDNYIHRNKSLYM